MIKKSFSSSFSLKPLKINTTIKCKSAWKRKKKKKEKKTSDFWHFFCFPIVLYLVLWNITQVLIPCSPPNYHLNNIKTRQPVIHLHYAKSHYLSQRLHVKCSCLRKNLSDLLTSRLHRKRDYVNKTKPDTVVCMQEKHITMLSDHPS